LCVLDIIIIMGINGWETYARLTRGMVLSANTHGYAVAVRTLGAKPSTIYMRHILPNISAPLIVLATILFLLVADLIVSRETHGVLSWIAMKLQRPLRWDPEAERFVDDDEANAMLTRPERAPFGALRLAAALASR
jgi:hypothetical protein